MVLREKWDNVRAKTLSMTTPYMHNCQIIGQSTIIKASALNEIVGFYIIWLSRTCSVCYVGVVIPDYLDGLSVERVWV